MSTSMTGASGSKIPKGYAAGRLQQFTPEQMGLFKSLFSQVSPQSNLAGLARGDESAFAPLEQQAQRGFQEFQGDLASRFSGMGSGARRSSGFQNSAGQLGSNFAQDLASRRSELQRGAIMDLHNMSQQLLGNRPYEQSLVKNQPKQGFDWGGAAGGLAGGVGGFFASGGNPMAAISGASLGYNVLGRGGKGNSQEDYSNFANSYLN